MDKKRKKQRIAGCWRRKIRADSLEGAMRLLVKVMDLPKIKTTS